MFDSPALTWSRPHLAICGGPSTGKSTLASYLSGQNILPAGAYHSTIPIRLLRAEAPLDGLFTLQWCGIGCNGSLVYATISRGPIMGIKKTIRGLFATPPSFSGDAALRFQSCEVILLEVSGPFQSIPVGGSIFKIPSLMSVEEKELAPLRRIFSTFSPQVLFTYASESMQRHDVPAFKATEMLVNSSQTPCTRIIFANTKFDIYSVRWDNGHQLSPELVQNAIQKRYDALRQVPLLEKYQQWLPKGPASLSTHFLAIDAITALYPNDPYPNRTLPSNSPLLEEVAHILRQIENQTAKTLRGTSLDCEDLQCPSHMKVSSDGDSMSSDPTTAREGIFGDFLHRRSTSCAGSASLTSPPSSGSISARSASHMKVSSDGDSTSSDPTDFNSSMGFVSPPMRPWSGASGRNLSSFQPYHFSALDNSIKTSSETDRMAASLSHSPETY